MRNTRQREVILDIINNSYCHPTAYEIYDICRKEIPNISLGTVYRNLNILADDKLIRRIILDDDSCRFDKALDNHAHFICDGCGNVIDIFENYFDDVLDIDGNIVSGYDVSFNGICKNCQGKEEK